MTDQTDPPPCPLPLLPIPPPIARPVELPVPDEPMPTAARRLPALVDLAIFAVSSVALAFAITNVALILHHLNIAGPPSAHPLLFQVALALVLCLLMAAILIVRKQPFASIGWTADDWLANAALGVAIWLAVMLFSMVLALMLLVFWPEAYESLASNRRNLGAVFDALTIPEILLLCIIIGVYEEVLFRGFVLTRLRQITRSGIAAVILTSLVFGSLHTYEGPVAVGLVSALGMVLGSVVLWRKSLVPAIVTHILFNTGMLLILHFDIAADPDMIHSLQ